jgi:hypothetical protein
MTGDVQLPADSEGPSDESLDCRNSADYEPER